MRRYSLSVLLLILMLPLGGCAYIASVSDNFEQQLNEWVEQEEYGTALRALSYVKPDRPDYRRLMVRRETILRLSQLYEKRTVNRAEEHLREGRWAEALQLYEVGLDKLPESKALSDGYVHLQRLQAQRLAELETDLLIARGNSLLELLPVYARRTEVDPKNRDLHQQLSKARDEAASVSTELTRRGSMALERNDMATAQRTLPLALRLQPSSDTKRANQALLQQVTTQQPVSSKPATEKPSRDEGSTELLQQYRQAFSRNDLPEARRIVAILELQPKPPAELVQIRRELETAIAASVRQHLDRGVALYSHGEYEKALANWHAAKVLDPDNERVNAHIARVERVLSKLQTLQQKQSN